MFVNRFVLVRMTAMCNGPSSRQWGGCFNDWMPSFRALGIPASAITHFHWLDRMSSGWAEERQSPLYCGRGAVDLMRPHTSIHWYRFLHEPPEHPRAEEVHNSVDCDREDCAPVGSQDQRQRTGRPFSSGVINGKEKWELMNEKDQSINQSIRAILITEAGCG